MNVTIWHNPRCSKSRATLQLLEEKGVSPSIISYLDAPPTAEELMQVLEALHCGPRDIMRKGEETYTEMGLGDESLSREALIAAMVKNPRLIERPIVIKGDRAAIGRPPESVLDIL